MNLDELVNQHYDDLNMNDLHIWGYIANHKRECAAMTIEEVAEKCNVSRTGILRFAKKISLQGFSELKFYLRMENVEENELTDEKIDSISQSYIKGIQSFTEQNLDKVCDEIYHAKRIFAYGSGVIQQSAVRELKRLMFKLNVIVYMINGTAEIGFLLNNLREGDVVFLFSLGGESAQICKFGKQLKEKDCKIVTITRMQHNTLAELADVAVYFSSMSKPIMIENHRFEPVTMFFFVVEMLFLRYAMYQHNKSIEESK